MCIVCLACTGNLGNLRNYAYAHIDEGLYGEARKRRTCRRVFVCLENTVMFPAGNGGPKYCGGFSETATLQSFLPIRHVRTVGHFFTESAHVHYW